MKKIIRIIAGNAVIIITQSISSEEFLTHWVWELHNNFFSKIKKPNSIYSISDLHIVDTDFFLSKKL